MTRHHLTYPLVQGYVDAWLVLGPCDTPLTAADENVIARSVFCDEAISSDARDCFGPHDGPRNDTPRGSLRAGEPAPEQARPDFCTPNELDRYACGAQTLFWTVAHCEADHQFDWSGFCPTVTRRQAWAFANLASRAALRPVSDRAMLHLTTTCPAALWLNGKLVGDCGGDAAPGQTPHTYTFTVDLNARNNELLIRLEQVGAGDVALAFALRVAGVADKTIQVKIPVLTGEVEYRQKLERTYRLAYLDRAVCLADDHVTLKFPADTPVEANAVMRMQTPDGWIYGEAYGMAKPQSEIPGIHGLASPDGVMEAVLMPPPQSYYELHLRAERKLPYWVANRPFAAAPAGSPDERLVDACREAQRQGGIFGILAAMAVGWWDAVEQDRIRAIVASVVRCQADCLPDLLGLIGMRLRMGHYEQFPAELLPEIDRCIQGFDYALGDAPLPAGIPHSDAASRPQETSLRGPSCGPKQSLASGEIASSQQTLLAMTPQKPFSVQMSLEANQILLYASRILAGQLFPDVTFGASGLSGQQERDLGEKSAAAWLRTHAQTGFALWNAHADLFVAALAHLVDLADADVVAELATVLLDKLLFGIAVHSLHGGFGGSRGLAEPAYLRSARFAPETGISRLLWGMGAYQAGLAGAVSLGLAGKSYEPPAILAAIANDDETEVWARERHAGANTVTYKTGDFILSSAQDYRPGGRGGREQVWQATLGPEALVFATHPTSFSQSASREAGWWRGNGALPRVAQWRDALIALYRLPDDDWLGFTHAYFPLYAFDVYKLEGHWACARVGAAYVAVYASQGFELMTRGPDAYRELRSHGPRNVWLCQMGHASADSNFESFCRRVVAASPAVDSLHVTWQTIRDDRLEFDWTGPLLRNGSEQPIAGFPHHESVFGAAEFPAETMDIVYDTDVMRLHLA